MIGTYKSEAISVNRDYFCVLEVRVIFTSKKYIFNQLFQVYNDVFIIIRKDKTTFYLF